MEHSVYIPCEKHGPHILHVNDGVIQNWAAAMFENGCPPMLMAVPQMLAALLEWRANWLGDTTLTAVEHSFQRIHDFWLAKHTGQPHPAPGQVQPHRIPGDWLDRFPVRPPPHHPPPDPRLVRTTFTDIQEFYNDNPIRRTSRECDYATWSNPGNPRQTYQVSYIQATGEIYAEHLSGPDRGMVILLGHLPPDRVADATFGNFHATLDQVLQGWTDASIRRQGAPWVKQRLARTGHTVY